MRNFSIFVDMDEVLVDFLLGIKQISGDELSQTFELKPQLKHKILETPDFWKTLPKKPDCDELWNYIKKYNPKILTAEPIWDKSAKKGKWEWIQEHCPIPKTNFYCVPRKDKQIFATINAKSNILIDDYDKNCKEWENRGGIAILHTSSKLTIIKLKSLGL